MLQWMGGSRKKVTASRKSTHKRQKQYFEQRKRQQQQTADFENYAYGKRSCISHNENNKSLDILSLANLATVVQDHKTWNVVNERENSDKGVFPLNNQGTHHLPSVLINEGFPMDHSEITEERTSLSYDTEAEHSNEVPVHIPDHNADLVGKGKKLDSFKLSIAHPLSVIDLLGDGGANSISEENLRHAQETHVAFSVEGLGEVAAETPVHSPKLPPRSSVRGFSPQVKSKRQSITSKHLDYDFDDLGSPEVEFSPNERLIEWPSCSRAVRNIFEDTDQKFLNIRKASPFNWSGDDLRGDFVNDEQIYNIPDRGKNFWNGSNFLDNSIDDLGGGYASFFENWMDPPNASYDDGFPNKEAWKKDTFSGWNVQKKWSSAKTSKHVDMKGPPVTNSKHQIAEDIPAVMIFDTRWSPPLGIYNDVKDSVNGFLSKDTRDSLSLLSERRRNKKIIRHIGEVVDFLMLRAQSSLTSVVNHDKM